MHLNYIDGIRNTLVDTQFVRKQAQKVYTPAQKQTELNAAMIDLCLNHCPNATKKCKGACEATRALAKKYKEKKANAKNSEGQTVEGV